MGNFDGVTFATFLEMFYNNELMFGDWFDVVHGYWNIRHKANILIVKYEDMHRRPLEGIRDVARFCGKSLTDDELQRIADHTTFKSMKVNEQINQLNGQYIRKGVVAGWKNHFTVTQNERFEHWFNKKMKDSDLQVDFSL